MGVSSGSSQQSGFSQYQSNPVNLQSPYYTGLSPFVAGGLQNIATGLGTPSGSTGMPGTEGYGFINPFTVNGQASNSSSNPLVAALSGAEGLDLGRLSSLITGGTPGQGNDLLASTSPVLAQMLGPNYARDLATSPQTQGAIQGAINPLETSFKNTTIPGLQSKFVAAGQNPNAPTGSSAFDRAANEAQSNLLAQEGAISSGITNSAYQTGLQQQSGAVNQAASVGTQEINNVLSDMQAQALPRLVQQYGINAGLQLYQSQVQSMLQSLGLSGQVSQPAIAYQSSGNGSSSGSSKNGGLSLGGFNPVPGFK